SVWPMRHRLGAAGSRPSRRATRDVRPGADSWRSRSSPLPSRSSARVVALRTSWPDSTDPSFTQALRISACSSSAVSLSAAPPTERSGVLGSGPHATGGPEDDLHPPRIGERGVPPAELAPPTGLPVDRGAMLLGPS